MDDRPSLLPERLSALPQRSSLYLKPRRFRKYARIVAIGVGLSTVFLASAGVAVVLHLGTGPARRVVKRVVNQAIGPVFQGRIVVGDIESLSLNHARIHEAWCYGPDGDETIHAFGIDAELKPMRLLRSLNAERSEPVLLVLPRVRIEKAVVSLAVDEEGIPTIATGFMPRSSSPPSPIPARPVVVAMPRVEIDEAAATGNVGVPLDARLRRLSANIFIRTDEVVAVDVDRAGIAERAILPAMIRGIASYSLRIDLRSDAVRRADTEHHDVMRMWASLDGAVGDVPVSARASMDGLDLVGSVDLPQATPAALAKIFPWLPIVRELRGRIKAEGHLPDLTLSGSFEIPQGSGVGTVLAEGELGAHNGVAFDLELAAAELDPRALFTFAPDMRVSGKSRIRVRLPPSGVADVSLDISTEPTIAFGQRVPAADAVFHLVDGAMIGSVALDEEGFPVDGRLRIEDGAVAFSVAAASDDLSRNPRVRAVLGGRGSARVDGTFKDGLLDADVTAKGSGLSVLGGPESGFSASTADLRGRVHGPIEALTIQGDAHATGVRVRDEDLDEVSVRVSGPVLEPTLVANVTDDARGVFTGSGTVSIPEKAAKNVRFSLERGGVKASGSAAIVQLQNGDVTARGLHVEGDGLGSVGGDLSISRGELAGHLHAEALDLGRVSRLVALPVQLSGIASAEVSLQHSATGRKGFVEVEIENGRVGRIPGVSARISAQFDGKGVESAGYVRLIDDPTREARKAAKDGGVLAHASLCDGPIAEVRFSSAKGELDGPLLDAETWRHAIGEVDVAAENARLDCLAQRFPEGKTGIDEAHGLLSTRFHVRRDKGDAYASIDDFYARSRGLEVTGTDEVWSTNRIDAELAGSLDGASGDVVLRAMLIDGMILADADLEATLDLGGLLAGRERAKTALTSAPLTVHVDMPRRKFAELVTLPYPASGIATLFDGELRASAELAGTFAQPTVAVSLHGFGLMPAFSGSARDLSPPLDVDLDVAYNPLIKHINGNADVRYDGTSVATLTTSLDLGSKPVTHDAAEATPTEAEPSQADAAPSFGIDFSAWRGDLDLELSDFPLASLPFLAERDVAGAVSGHVSAKGLHDAPIVDAQLRAPLLKLGDAFLKAEVRAQIEARAGNATLDAGAIDASSYIGTLGNGTLSVDIEGEDGGQLNVVAYAGTRWRDLSVPVIDPGAAGGLALTARKFRLAAAYPFFAGILSKLDGKLDGDVALEWGSFSEASKGTIKHGELTVSDAVVYIPELGQELMGGKAHVVAHPEADGKQEIVVDALEAQGTAGRVHGEATVTLNGLAFERAALSLGIDKGEELPITLQGVPLGTARGQIDAIVTHEPSQLNLAVTVPDFEFQLPQSSSKNVQGLDDAPGIKIEQALGPEKEARDAAALRYALTVDLRKVALKSTSIDARVSTPPGAPLHLLLSDRLHASGDILFDDGSLELNGKKFEVDSGLVRLRDEETGNPYVNLTAHWDASGDSRVFVDYVGLLSPITEDKIHFRSDPPRSSAEIASLLVFGDNGATATGLVGTVGGSVATSLANNLIANAFGGALRDVLAVSVGTTESGGVFGAQVAVSDSVSLGGTFEQIQGDTSVNRASGGCGDLYFDYKVSTHWSLRGTGGYCYADTQSAATTSNQEGVTVGLDALWQYRY